MKFVGLVLKSARRSKRRTLLTVLSVAVAVFLFASLRAVIDGFNAGAEASSSTRIVTIRSTSLMFEMPTSHVETIRSMPGVQDVTWASWFGGIYKDPKNFFGQIAVEPEGYLRMYPEILLTPEEQQGLPRRSHRLHRRRRPREDVRLQGRRQDHAEGRHPALRPAGLRLQRARDLPVGRRRGRQPDDDVSLEVSRRALRCRRGRSAGSSRRSPIPIRRRRSRRRSIRSSPTRRTKPRPTRSGRFRRSFVSMFGNLNLLLGSIAPAVVITTLFVAGNTMAMSVRERTTEIAVMRTLGLPARHDFHAHRRRRADDVDRRRRHRRRARAHVRQSELPVRGRDDSRDRRQHREHARGRSASASSSACSPASFPPRWRRGSRSSTRCGGSPRWASSPATTSAR